MEVFEMKIAIMYDMLENVGGGEKIAIQAAKELDATIITANLSNDALREMNGENLEIINLGKLPNHYALKHSLAIKKYYNCNFSNDFDFFILMGNRAVFAAKNHRPNLWYCMSLERAAYDLHDFYLRNSPFLEKPLVMASGGIYRNAHAKFALPHVERIACISRNTREKLKKYLGKEAEVIYPFHEKYGNGFSTGDYWLSVNRLYPYKRVELQVEAFRKMPEKKLLIAGSFRKGDPSEKYYKKISRNSPENVSFLGNAGNQFEMQKLYNNCIGLVATSIDEDFGMSVVEAMAAGKAVVAVDEGGFRETILDGKTGFLVDADVDDIVEAVQKVSENPGKYRKACVERAKEFGKERFVEKIKRIISEGVEGRQSKGERTMTV